MAAPEAVARRIARFHLVDNTRGEPPHWRPAEVRLIELTATAGESGTLLLEGAFHLETGDGKRGFEGRMLGSCRLAGGRENPTIEAFQLVACGDCWGEGRFTRGARPGRQPLGVVFSLADPDRAADRVPPQGARWEKGYYEP